MDSEGRVGEVRDRVVRLEARFDHAPNHETLRRMRTEIRGETSEEIKRIGADLSRQMREQGKDQSVAIDTALNTALERCERRIDERFKEYEADREAREKKAADRRAAWWKTAIGVLAILWMVFGGNAGEARAFNVIGGGIMPFWGK
jgi:hypothetical protein